MTAFFLVFAIAIFAALAKIAYEIERGVNQSAANNRALWAIHDDLMAIKERINVNY